MKELKGIHHVTAMTSSAEKNYAFYTETLGMRLVKKTVNQDDIQTYHLFFADDAGSAGTDMTFFDFPNLPKGRKGTDSISKTSFRVPSDAALDYWVERFDSLGVDHDAITESFGKKVLGFRDFDEQSLQLISDENNEGVAPGIPWKNGPVPAEFAIYGLGPVYLTVQNKENIGLVLTVILGFREVATEGGEHLYEVGEGGNGAQVIVEERTDILPAMQGYGNVHHVAFRVEDHAELEKWIARANEFQAPNSGYVDRFYFESLYMPVSQQILFEFATDGPGFAQDEPYETMGEKLSLPPFLESKRAAIEAEVRPLNTKRG
ncbi:ring-cleaving dioxygenase [Listeria booriae]|uniref:Glyoxalase n=1 Tax=Listeria booriae TaxID=1552123 RepID=A0A099W7U5_9LIST|nr:ring-cleaving dioxygenase [Listeria booriae]KGL40841.1 glyoxalase [Listeria booriae]MBC1210023.1 ring-cleaving dioxygenase [Listeria booriae]MBC1232597.1 ring-cleaving dioxygenase [Listeria booriae]MBC1246417.1 ring-cleaving dioxygenase [Listeria booriae]MBC1284579.1 ring-cleaving dioxygenase [Listeria booriae]